MLPLITPSPPALPTRSLAAPSALRPAAVFPGARLAEDVPRLEWAGGGDELRRWASDHAEAVGAVLGDPATGAAAPHALLGTLPALARRVARSRGARLPLVALAPAERLGETEWRLAITLGVRALVRVPGQSSDLLELLAELVRAPGGALVIGVVGACGGAGTSSLAARLAGAAARERRETVLVDADPLGGGLDLLVEAGEARGACWEDLGEIGVQDGPALRDGLAVVDGVRLLVARAAGLPDADLTARALQALGPLGGTVVLDLGPHQVGAVLPFLDRLILLSPATDHAVRAAGRRLDLWRPDASRIGLVVRGRGQVGPAEAARDLGLELLGRFRDSPPGTVPLLDVRRGGADALCSRLLRDLSPAGADTAHVRLPGRSR